MKVLRDTTENVRFIYVHFLMNSSFSRFSRKSGGTLAFDADSNNGRAFAISVFKRKIYQLRPIVITAQIVSSPP